MGRWLYFGSNRVWARGSRITLPPSLFGEIFSEDDSRVYWFIDDKSGLITLADRPLSVSHLNDLDSSQTPDLVYSSGSYNIQIPPDFFGQGCEDSKPSFTHSELAHFISTTDRAEGKPRKCLLASTKELLDTISDSSCWRTSSENLERLNELRNLEDESSQLFPDYFISEKGPQEFEEEYQYSPTKEGQIIVERKIPDNLRAKWIKHANSGMFPDWQQPPRMAIVVEFHILDRENRVIEQTGETIQYKADRERELHDEIGPLNHIPLAIVRALKQGNWTIKGHEDRRA